MEYYVRSSKKKKKGNLTFCESMDGLSENDKYCIFQTIRCTPQIWEENGGASYSPNVAYLAHWDGRGAALERGYFSYFLPLKPRCVLWSGVLYSLKNTVLYDFTYLWDLKNKLN